MKAPRRASEPAPIRAGSLTMRFGQRPYLMGIVNVTPDSFSDGGQFFEPERAFAHAIELVEAGADILDVGGESTRPGSDPVSADEELRRILPIVEHVAKYTMVAISIDTTKAAVAEAALASGASLVNDVSALRFDPQMASVVARAGVPLVVMHMLGTPKTMQRDPIVYQDVVAEVSAFLADAVSRARGLGIAEEQIIIDPGLGFGKKVEHNLEILRRVGELRALGRPLLLGPSRKAFIGSVLDLEAKDRLHGTAAAVAAAVLGGAHIVRVHDVGPMRQVARVAHAIRTGEFA